MGVIQPTPTGVLVQVRVQPRASAERLDGVHDERLRLRVTAPPVASAANAACLALLAKTLGVGRAQVRLQAGQRSRNKLIHIVGLTAAEVATALGISHR